MRQLTDSELIARDAAKSSSDVPYLTDDLEHYIFDTGFAAALDHTDRQMTQLRAETAALTAELDGLRAEVTRLREALFKATKDLKRMARDWREHAAGDYCQTYNPEMGRGLRNAASNLEDYINDKITENQK